MKNLCTTVLGILLTFASFAQNSVAILHSPNVHRVNSVPTLHRVQMSNVHHDERNLTNVNLDYNTTNFNLNGIVSGGIVVPTNSRYSCNDFFTMRWVGVSFDSLIDANTLVSYWYPLSTVTIDSISAVIGHENNSGTEDTIILNVASLLNNDTYLTDNILYTDTIYTNSGLSPGNSWLGGAVISAAPGLTLPQGEKFGVKIKYYGSPLDSFSVIGNKYDDCSGACASERSLIYPTSFYYFNYDTNGTNYCQEWPDTSALGEVFFDCDNSGGYSPNFCEDPDWQNFDIIAKVTVDAQLAVTANAASGFICSGTSDQLLAQGFGGSGTYSYSWMPGTGLSNPNIANPTASPASNTTYTVTVDDGNSTATASVTVTVSSVTVDLGPDQNIDCGQVITLTPTVGGSFFGVTYIWNNGSTSPTLNNVGPGTYSVTVTNTSGCTATDDVVITEGGPSCLWPGDADNDGVCDNNDLLAIGLAYGITGASRADQTMTWDAKASTDWNDTLPNGINDKYSDANGNGAVTSDDTLAVTANYGLTHPKAGQVNGSNPPLYFVFQSDTLNPGETVDVSVILGNDSAQINSMYGIAFTMNYDDAVVDAATVRFEAATGWMGTIGTNLMSFGKNLEAQNRIDAAVVRTNQANTNGFGLIGTLHFKVRSDVTGNQSLTLSTSGIRMIDNELNNLGVNGSTSTVDVIEVGINNLLISESSVSLYPIPATDQIYVQSLTANISSISIHDVLGREVLQLNTLNEKNITVSLKGFSPGVYLMKVQTEKGEVEKKFVVE